MIRNGHRSLSTKVAATKLKVLQSIVNVTKAGTYTLMYLGRVLTCVVNTVGPQIVRKNIQKNRMLISLSNILYSRASTEKKINFSNSNSI